MDDVVLRQSLVDLLSGEHAHVGERRAIEGISPNKRNLRPSPAVHSAWEDLEHMRIAQEDILRYTLDRSWKSPKWPEGYWPASGDSVTDEMWNASVSGFFSDLEQLVKLVKNSSLDLTAEIPHGEGRTYLREVLLVADHNAYHLGQIVQTRKALGDWPE
jgi:DinB family protein